jgi:hypothetical protein
VFSYLFASIWMMIMTLLACSLAGAATEITQII